MTDFSPQLSPDVAAHLRNIETRAVNLGFRDGGAFCKACGMPNTTWWRWITAQVKKPNPSSLHVLETRLGTLEDAAASDAAA